MTVSYLLKLMSYRCMWTKSRDRFSKEELDKFFDILYDGENKNRVWVHSHFGTNDIDGIFTKLRFMIIGCDYEWVVVDHLHMLVSAVYEGDERHAIDSIMTRLKKLGRKRIQESF